MNKLKSFLPSFFEGQLPDLRAMYCIYLVCIVPTHNSIEYEIKFLVAVLGFLGLMFPALRNKASLWFCLTLVLATNLFFSYTSTANHFFLTIYVAFLLAVTCVIEARGGKPSFNMARVLMAVVFSFATFHKIQSAYFRSGRLLGDYIFEGFSLPGILNFWSPGFLEHFVPAYKGSIDTLIEGNILVTQSVVVPEIAGGILLFCQIMAWVIITMELLLCVSLIWNKTFFSNFMPALFLAFICGTFSFRNEYAFFSLASILFLMASPHLKPNWRYVIALSAFILLGLEIGDIWIKF
jgi:hypothetical protein